MNIPILDVLSKAADKLWPDAGEREANKLRMLELAQNGEFKEAEMAMQAIMAEANSKDAWTSRARPSFLYVMYVYLLMALPLGVIGVWFPEQVVAGTEAAKAYLASIPTEMWTLFGAGYLGYVKKRSDDKEVSAGREPKKFLGLF